MVGRGARRATFLTYSIVFLRRGRGLFLRRFFVRQWGASVSRVRLQGGTGVVGVGDNIRRTVYVLVVLTARVSEHPVGDTVLDEHLSISSSCLGGIVHSLIISNLISSRSNGSNKFQLGQVPRRVAVLRVCRTVRKARDFIHPAGLTRGIFLQTSGVGGGGGRILSMFFSTRRRFGTHLRGCALSSLLIRKSSEIRGMS